MKLFSTPILPAHRTFIGMDNVRRACWRSKSGLVGAAICAILLCGFIEPVRADVVITPTALNIGIPTGQTVAWGSITATNTGVAPVTITWNDAVHCLQNLNPRTRTLPAGTSTTFTIEGVCPATGSATLSGTGVPTVTIHVSITSVPAIGLSPTSLDYAEMVGSTNPTAQTIAISNVGGGTLTWSAGDGVAWLALSPASGTNAGTVTASVNPLDWSVGNLHRHHVSDGDRRPTKTIPVTMTVTASTSSGSGFSISPTTLAYTATVGGANNLGSVTVKNTGSKAMTVTWADPLHWLVVIQPGITQTIQPGHSGAFTLTASTAGLGAGTYSGTATISGGGLTKQVPVTLTLTAVTQPTRPLSPGMPIPTQIW